MKRIAYRLVLVFITFSAFCQKTESKVTLLISHVWKIRSDEMKGIGVHNSVPKETTIEFLKDNTWKSSLPINSSTQGKWLLDDKEGTLSMTYGDQKRNTHCWN